MNIPGFITRNFKLKIGCTVMALITWVGVVYASNPPETRLVMVDVPQQTSAIPAKYTLVHSVPDLALRIGGSRSSLDAFNTSDLSVSVAWHNVTSAGVQTIPISIVNADPNIELIDPPTSISADIDYLGSVSLPVNINVTHPPPAGYTIASETASPDTVIVSGPHHELSGLEARVTVDLGNNKTNFAEDALVFIYDARGNQLSDLTVSSPPGSNVTGGEVKVTILVTSNITSRAAAVDPSFIGYPASGHQVTAIRVSPSTVVLAGPQNLLNALDNVRTSTISLSGLTGSLTFNATVLPPTGVTATPVRVTITVIVVTLATPPPSFAPTPTPTPTPSPSATT